MYSSQGGYDSDVGKTFVRRGVGRPSSVEGPAITLDQLVETSLRLAEREGFSALSVNQLASELGVSARTVYHYVSSKNGLLELVAGAALRSRRWQALPADGPWDTRLRAIVVAWHEVLTRFPGLAVYLLSTPAGSWVVSRQREHEYVLATLADAGLGEREARETLMLLATFVFGLIEIETKLPGEVEPSLPAHGALPPRLDFALDLFIEGVRGMSSLALHEAGSQ
jgi:AcrR family transcriptional regulator